MTLLFDPLFRIPLLVGLLAAILLPLLGCWLRLREEWLAALGLAHLAGAGALAGMAVHVPVALAAPLGALAGALGKAVAGSRGNSGYALMILAGWSLTLLVAANTALGESLAHALVDGQLYFAGRQQLLAMAAVTVAAVVALPWLNQRLLRARFMPEDEAANGRPAWRWHGSFDLLVALALAMATTSIGLMAAFALVFLPPWLAFSLARSWRAALLWSPALGVAGYLIAFVLALSADQPFGPTLVGVVLGLGAVVGGVARLGKS